MRGITRNNKDGATRRAPCSPRLGFPEPREARRARPPTGRARNARGAWTYYRPPTDPSL